MMQHCSQCKVAFYSPGTWFMDYCALCSRHLCHQCMMSGCCGRTPAQSGQEADIDDIAADMDISPVHRLADAATASRTSGFHETSDESATK